MVASSAKSKGSYRNLARDYTFYLCFSELRHNYSREHFVYHLCRASFIAHLNFQQNMLPTQQQWLKTTLRLSWYLFHPVTAALYRWCLPRNHFKFLKRVCITSRIFKYKEKSTSTWRELIYKLEVLLASSVSGTWVNYIMLFRSELTILFIPWRQINFASVPLCAQISCFLDFTPLLLPTNRRFLLSFLLQLNL